MSLPSHILNSWDLYGGDGYVQQLVNDSSTPNDIFKACRNPPQVLIEYISRTKASVSAIKRIWFSKCVFIWLKWTLYDTIPDWKKMTRKMIQDIIRVCVEEVPLESEAVAEAKAQEDAFAMSLAVDTLMDLMKEVMDIPTVLDMTSCPHRLRFVYWFGFSPICSTCKRLLESNWERKDTLLTQVMAKVMDLNLHTKKEKEYAARVEAMMDGMGGAVAMSGKEEKRVSAKPRR